RPPAARAGPSPFETLARFRRARSSGVTGERLETAVRHSAMDRFIDGIELVAAIFVGLVAADVFITVVLRSTFSWSIPDSYDFGRMLLGILIFWGIAATSY